MRTSLTVFVALMLAGAPAWAAGIAGQATDPSGRPIPAARAVLHNLATGAQVEAVADDEGRFTFDQLAVGIYRLVLGQPGFSEDARTISIADAGETVEVQMILRPGGITAGVTVTAATRAQRDTLDVPLRTDTVSAAEIQDLAPTSTGDALVRVPGVTPVGNGPFSVRPRLRGLDSTRLLVLVDGERLNNARTATDRAGIEVGLVDVNSIESIEVVSGAGSVLYGTDALAGTINIITNQPRFSDTLRVNYGLDGFFSSNETGRRGTATLGVSNRRFAAQFAGTVEAFDDYSAGGGAGEENTQPLFQSGQLVQADTIDDAFGFNFGLFPDPFNAPFSRTGDEIPASGARGNAFNVAGVYALTATQTIRVKYIRRHMHDVGFPDFEAPYFFQRVSLPYSDLDRFSARYEVQGITPWFTNLKATAYYQDQDRLLRNELPVQFPVPSPRFFPIQVFRLNILSDTRQHVTTPGIDVQGTFLAGRSHVITAGIMAYRDRSEDSRRTVTETTTIGSVAVGNRGPQAIVSAPIPLGPPVISNPVRVPDSSFRDIGVFAQDEWTLGPGVTVVAGLRVDGYKVTTDPTPGYDVESLLTGAEPPIDPATLPSIGGDEISRTAVTGDLGVVYQPMERVSVLAHYGRSYRHPNLEELLFAGPATIGSIVPNVRVEPETGNNLDFGLKYRGPRFGGSLSYFNNRYDGFISTEIVALTPTDSLSQAINFADVRLQGVEADGEVPFVLRRGVVTAYGTMAYLRGTVISGTNPLTGASLDGTAADNITPLKTLIGGRFTDIRDRWWVDYSVRAQAEVDRVAPTLIDSPFLIAQDLLSLQGFAIQRLAVGLNFRQNARRVGLTFAVENLADTFYREHFQFAPARGRTFTIGLHLRSN